MVIMESVNARSIWSEDRSIWSKLLVYQKAVLKKLFKFRHRPCEFGTKIVMTYGTLRDFYEQLFCGTFMSGCFEYESLRQNQYLKERDLHLVAFVVLSRLDIFFCIRKTFS